MLNPLSELEKQLRLDTERYIASKKVDILADMERERRLEEALILLGGETMAMSPTCEAVKEELLLRADAKALSRLERTWAATRKYSSIKAEVSLPRGHFTAFARNVFNAPCAMKCANYKSLARTDKQKLAERRLREGTAIHLINEDAKILARLARTWMATRKYSDIYERIWPTHVAHNRRQ